MNKPILRLGTVATIIMGQAPPSADTNFDGEGTPFVKAGEFGQDRPIIREWTTKPLRLAKRDDVLVCVVGATCGKTNLGEDCAIGRSVAAIRPTRDRLNQKFLYYLIQFHTLRLRQGSAGAAQTVISRDMLSEIKVTEPDIRKQERIVAILDQAFDGIAEAETNTSVSLESAQNTLTAHLGSTLSERLAKHKNRSLLSSCSLFFDSAHRTPKYQTEGFPALRPRDVVSGVLNLERAARVCEEEYQVQCKRYAPRYGDIVYSRE